MSPFAAEFVPRFVPSPKVQQPTYNAPAPNGRDWMKAVESFPDELEPDDYLALSELKEVIDNISSTPSNYEGLVVHITEILNNCVDEDEDIVLQCVVNTIVDQVCFKFPSSIYVIIIFLIGNYGSKLSLQWCSNVRSSYRKFNNWGN